MDVFVFFIYLKKPLFEARTVFLASHPPYLRYLDSLTEVTAQNLFTGLEVPVVISHKEAFDDYLDTVIGEFCG